MTFTRERPKTGSDGHLSVRFGFLVRIFGSVRIFWFGFLVRFFGSDSYFWFGCFVRIRIFGSDDFLVDSEFMIFDSDMCLFDSEYIKFDSDVCYLTRTLNNDYVLLLMLNFRTFYSTNHLKLLQHR